MKTRFISKLDADRVNFGLQKTSPDLANLGEAVQIADGFSSHVFVVGDEVILRVAKNRETAIQQAKEFEVLPRLQGRLSVQIPQPRWHLEFSEHFPFGAIAYPKITGRPFDLALSNQVDLENVASSLATFLLELHSLEPHVLSDQQDNEPALLWEAVKSVLRTHLDEAGYAVAETWWHSFAQRSSASKGNPMKLVHGDLWGENIILNDSLSQVVGIIDFEWLTRGDIAQDFAPQRYVSPDFADLVSRKFQTLGGQLGEHFEQRVYDWSILRELRGLAHAIDYPESDELEDSLQKVARFWSSKP